MATRPARARRAAERRGRFAETLACLMLLAKGYRILARRARTPWGEVDVLARRGDILAVVEVKGRQTRAEGLSAVGPMQQQRIAQAGLSLAARLRLTDLRMRFDVVVVGPGLWPAHVPDAWRP